MLSSKLAQVELMIFFLMSETEKGTKKSGERGAALDQKREAKDFRKDHLCLRGPPNLRRLLCVVGKDENKILEILAQNAS